MHNTLQLDNHRRSPLETPAFRQGEERGALDVALVFDILLDDLQGCAADSGDEIRVGPERGEPGLEGRELLTENTRRPSFDLLDESVDSVLRVAFDQQVYVIGHVFQLDDLALSFGGDLSYDLLKAVGHVVGDDGSAVFRAPDNVVGTSVDDVVVRSDFNHIDTI